MSRGNRPKPPRTRRQRPDVEIAFSAPALCIDEEDEIHHYMHLTHDDLIRRLGANRRSRITWNIRRGREQCEEYLTALESSPDRDFHYELAPGELNFALDQYRAFLREHGDRAVMVLATCEAVHG